MTSGYFRKRELNCMLLQAVSQYGERHTMRLDLLLQLSLWVY